MRLVRLHPFWTACLAATLLFACGGEEQVPGPVVRPVRTEAVYGTGGSRARSFSGTCRAALESRLSFKVAGTVKHVAVQVGDRVETGQLIAELEARDYELQVQEAEAALKSANAQARNANRNLSRVRSLYENQNASLNDLDAARAAWESAEAQDRAAQNRVALARSQLSYTRLISRMEGSVASVTVEENENVAPGQPVALLTSGSDLEVQVAMPGVLIAQIREGDASTVSFDAIPGKELSGTVTEVGVSSTGMATTFPVTVRLHQADPKCRPGMAAEVTFRFDAGGDRERILVPASAVGEDPEGRFVYVVDADDEGKGIVHRRSVTIRLVGKDIEVLKGLSDGERVVTAGVTRIQDGQKVKLLGTSP
jgi:membrane fusion protein, multidrug efflux system